MVTLSPLDSRYSRYTCQLSECMSERAYVEDRIMVELKYLNAILTVLKIAPYDISKFEKISDEEYDNFKKIEHETKHDVKAIEIFMRTWIKKYIPTFCHEEYIHYGLTSQDANSLGFMIGCRNGLHIILDKLFRMNSKLGVLITKCQHITIITKTHGQPAVPSNLGKELYVHYVSIDKNINQLKDMIKKLTVKFGGAVGNMNALTYVHPEIDWLSFSDNFVDSFGFTRSQFTTQVDDYSNLCEVLYKIILIGKQIYRMCNYVWLLISDEYFAQVPVETEIGSSTMPHKINPINFENAKGNIPLASHMLTGIIEVLMGLTYQRDMSDSTVLRSLGSAFGYFMVAFGEICVGIDKLIPNEHKIKDDHNKYAVVIMEGIQTYLKKIGCKTAYELAKEFSRRSDISITLSDIHHNFIAKLDVADDIKEHLLKLTPETYVGVYPELIIFNYDMD